MIGRCVLKFVFDTSHNAIHSVRHLVCTQSLHFERLERVELYFANGLSLVKAHHQAGSIESLPSPPGKRRAKTLSLGKKASQDYQDSEAFQTTYKSPARAHSA